MATLDSLGDRLRYLRKRKGISQAEAGAACGVARSTYTGYESGADTPSRDTLIAIADMFGASLDWIEGRLDKVDMPELGNFIKDRDELALLALWRGMDNETRRHLVGLMANSAPRRTSPGTGTA